MNKHIKVCLASIILATTVVVIHGFIGYFFASKIFNIFNFRSLILFIVVFFGSLTTIGEGTERTDCFS